MSCNGACATANRRLYSRRPLGWAVVDMFEPGHETAITAYPFSRVYPRHVRRLARQDERSIKRASRRGCALGVERYGENLLWSDYARLSLGDRLSPLEVRTRQGGRARATEAAITG
jgi:hypothetical protein